MRKSGLIPYLRPDGKTQVSIIYDEDDRPLSLDNVVVSAQHHPEVDQETIYADIRKNVIEPIVPSELWTEQTKCWSIPRVVLSSEALWVMPDLPAARLLWTAMVALADMVAEPFRVRTLES